MTKKRFSAVVEEYSIHQGQASSDCGYPHSSTTWRWLPHSSGS